MTTSPQITTLAGVLLGPKRGQDSTADDSLWQISDGTQITECLIPSPTLRSELLMHPIVRHNFQTVRWHLLAKKDVDAVPVVTSADYDPEFDAPLRLLPPDICPVPRLVEAAVDLIHEIDSDPLRRMVERVLLRRDVAAKYWTMPASARHHHSSPGGLALHSFEVAMDLAGQGQLEAHERDLCIAAGFLHDIGKTWAYTKDMFCTTEARAVGHDLLGLARVHPDLERLEREWPDGAFAMRALLSGSTHRRKDGTMPTALIARLKAADQRSCERDLDKRGPGRTWIPQAYLPRPGFPGMRASASLDQPF